MTLDTVIGLVAMAVAAFALRSVGILFGGLIPSTGKPGQFLREMPGAVMISLSAPVVVNGGPAEWAATVITALVSWRTRSLFWALPTGLLSVLVLRQVF
jgi:uncharacterized membrane protein